MAVKGRVGSFYRFVKNIEFFRYFLVGIAATTVDWGIFYFLAVMNNVFYQLALIVALSVGSLTNFLLNKVFTFRCKSRMLVQQMSVYIGVVVVSFATSSAIMFLFVDMLLLEKMLSRILTTFVMLVINYLLQKYITFNRKIFRQG